MVESHGELHDRSRFIGIMSGTSLDGADAALVDFSSKMPRTLAFATVPFDGPLRERLLALSQPESDSLELAGAVCLALADAYAQAAKAAIAAACVPASSVAAIGCHGQTVRHRPARGFTIQLNDPARVAEQTGIDVVADFRRRDMAAGGQGAPLAPAFHEAAFRHPERSRAIVNIGGIANVTWLAPGRTTLGFDCGPGNVLLDEWCRTHTGAGYDHDGRWACTGNMDTALLARLMQESFLDASPPKSTGRELFRSAWLQERLPRQARPEDVQATLMEYTARCIVDAIVRFCGSTEEIYLAGGGARNTAMVARIAALATPRKVALTDDLGVPTGHVEAVAFAWLAMKCVRREPIDLTTITGARGPRVLGAIYPA